MNDLYMSYYGCVPTFAASKIYSLYNVHYRFLILPINMRIQSMKFIMKNLNILRIQSIKTVIGIKTEFCISAQICIHTHAHTIYTDTLL